jgi:toxin CptA
MIPSDLDGGNTAALELRLVPSFRLAALMAALHSLGMVAIVAAALPGLVKSTLAAALVVTLARALQVHVFSLSGRSIVMLRVAADRTVVLETRAGGVVPGTVRDETLVLPLVVILRLATDGGDRTAVILPDAMDEDGFRRLRVFLRWGRQGKDAQEAEPGGLPPEAA